MSAALHGTDAGKLDVARQKEATADKMSSWAK
jgi:hypothetical protein